MKLCDSKQFADILLGYLDAAKRKLLSIPSDYHSETISLTGISHPVVSPCSLLYQASSTSNSTAPGFSVKLDRTGPTDFDSSAGSKTPGEDGPLDGG